MTAPPEDHAHIPAAPDAVALREVVPVQTQAQAQVPVDPDEGNSFLSGFLFWFLANLFRHTFVLVVVRYPLHMFTSNYVCAYRTLYEFQFVCADVFLL